MLRRATHTTDAGALTTIAGWPRPVELFGVPISPAPCDQAADAVIAAAESGAAGVVSCHSVHALITASREEPLASMARSFEMITPDGQPIRWALNLLYRARLKEPVTGRALTRAVCAGCPVRRADLSLRQHAGGDRGARD